MTRNDDQRIVASLVTSMAMICMRNSRLETLQAGSGPVTHAGDYSDVSVLDADGRHITVALAARCGNAGR
jgi:hypothetical protein